MSACLHSLSLFLLFYCKLASSVPKCILKFSSSFIKKVEFMLIINWTNISKMLFQNIIHITIIEVFGQVVTKSFTVHWCFSQFRPATGCPLTHAPTACCLSHPGLGYQCVPSRQHEAVTLPWDSLIESYFTPGTTQTFSTAHTCKPMLTGRVTL